MTEHVTIVGGGVYGSSLAWRLAVAGFGVHLVDADEPAAGASGGPGHRGVRGSGRDLAELALMNAAYDTWQRLSDDLQADVGYERIGSIRVYEEQVTGISGGWVSAPARAQVQQSYGVPSTLLSRDELRDQYPFVSQSAIGALHAPLDGTVDHAATTRAFVAAALRSGATLRTEARVEGLVVDGGRVTSLDLADGSRIDVPGVLVLLANTDVPRLLGRTALPQWAMRPQMIFASYERPMVVPSLVSHDSRRVSIKSLDDGRAMISGGWPGETTAAAVALDQLPATAAANFAEAVAVIPALADVLHFDLDASRVESISVDGTPVVDRVPGLDNALFGTGWTGHGFAISVELTRLLARWIETGNRPDSLSPFALARFAPA
jgi:sarcosine oxidase subunit beta